MSNLKNTKRKIDSSKLIPGEYYKTNAYSQVSARIIKFPGSKTDGCHDFQVERVEFEGKMLTPAKYFLATGTKFLVNPKPMSEDTLYLYQPRLCDGNGNIYPESEQIHFINAQPTASVSTPTNTEWSEKFNTLSQRVQALEERFAN